MTASQAPARMTLFLLDTHVLVWLFEGNTKLGRAARAAIQGAADENGALVSAITPWEIGLLVNKGRLKLGAEVMQWIRSVLAKPGVQLAALSPEIAVDSTRLPFAVHPDPADRILVATARHLGATLVTADARLLEIAGQGHFRALDAES